MFYHFTQNEIFNTSYATISITPLICSFFASGKQNLRTDTNHADYQYHSTSIARHRQRGWTHTARRCPRSYVTLV